MTDPTTATTPAAAGQTVAAAPDEVLRLPVKARATPKGWRVTAVVGESTHAGSAAGLRRALDLLVDAAEEELGPDQPFLLEPTEFDLTAISARTNAALFELRYKRAQLDREEAAWRRARRVIVLELDEHLTATDIATVLGVAASEIPKIRQEEEA